VCMPFGGVVVTFSMLRRLMNCRIIIITIMLSCDHLCLLCCTLVNSEI